MDKEYTEAVFTLAAFPTIFGAVLIMAGTVVLFQEGVYSHFFSAGGLVLGAVAGFVGYSLSRVK